MLLVINNLRQWWRAKGESGAENIPVRQDRVLSERNLLSRERWVASIGYRLLVGDLR